MKLYCSSDNKSEKFQLATMPVSKFGVGWVLSNSKELVQSHGAYLYQVKTDLADRIMRQDIKNWSAINRDKIALVIRSGDTARLKNFSGIESEKINQYIDKISNNPLYQSLQIIRSDLFKNKDQKWAAAVAEYVEISAIIMGTNPVMVLCWDPSKLAEFTLVGINSRRQ